ncbi:MAG: Hsp70 family protein [Pseudonocardiales bacterium]|nr:Hsp70 family protein [Pseudonocardiales bacterium]MBV9029641.1 Hsp70 family protein [Pseudonocardiales bacterium]
MSYRLGVDLGTTFVAAALSTAAGVEMFTLGDRSVVAPAAVYLREDGTVVTGEAAGLRVVSSPDRGGREFKRRLGNPTPMILGGQPYTVTELLGFLLRDVLRKVTETEGEPPDHVVLTHPANWGPFRRALFEEVPHLVGLENPHLVTEPEAAAAHYAASRQLDDGQTVAVYDLGGGTFDATVLRKHPGSVEIIGTPEGIERLGGVDFDDAILSYVDYSAGGALRELDLRDPQTTVALARLRQDCILAKEALSVDTETILPVFLPGRHFDVRITRSDFEDMVRAPIESTIGALSRTLRSAQIEPADLGAVLLVGGSSRIPLVARMVSAELGRPTVIDTHPKYAVALGAATLAARRAHPHYDGPHHDAGRSIGHSAAAPSGALPTPRTPSHDALPSAARPTPEGGAARRAATGQAPAPKATSRPPPLAGTPPRDSRQPGTGAGPGLPRSASGTEGAITIDPITPAGPPSPGGLTVRGRRLRALIGTGALLVLAGLIVLVVFVATNLLRAPSPSGSAPESAPTTAGAAGPEHAIPALGATIAVGSTPTFVAISPTGRQAYVARGNAGVVTVLDTAINHVTATVPIAAGPPQFLAFAPDGRRLYISIFNDQATIHVIDVLDTAANTVIATIPQPARPFLPAVTPDGKRLFVPNHDTAAVSVIDTATNAVIAQIKVAPNPHWVAFSRDGRLAYTANHESNVVSVIDTATLKVLATIPVGTSPHSVAISLDRPLVASANYDANSVTEIDTTTNKVVATIPVERNPRDIAWAPDGQFAYVVNEGSNSISVIDARTNQVTATIPTGGSPNTIAILPDGRKAYVSNLDSGTLTTLELAG